MSITGGIPTYSYAPLPAVPEPTNMRRASQRATSNKGILKVESKVRADAVISIEQRIVIKRIGRVANPKYQQIITLVQKLISAA